MFRALLICADGECAEVFEAYGPLEELGTLACDCGYVLEVLEIADQTSHRGEEVQLTRFG